MWVRAGRPNSGPINENRRLLRKQFKTALRESRLYKEHILGDEVARLHMRKTAKPFWRTVQKMKSSHLSTPCEIDGTTGSDNICDLWKNQYQSVFNSVPESHVEGYEKSHTEMRNFQFSPILFDEVRSALSKMKCDKACGLDGVPVECFLYGTTVLLKHLTRIFNTCISHAHFPTLLSNSFITPVIKNKYGDLNNKNNYRPIAIASAISKIFEYILRCRILPFIKSSDHQMSFKPNVGTETCVFLLKEIVRSYIGNSTPVHCCFLDASKAFDRINHSKLFNKLHQRGVPKYLIAILANWYKTSRTSVRWGNSLSNSFCSSNGVRQGSLLSPVLFALYVDDLSKLLSEAKIGCCVGSLIVNHIFYADDIVLFSPSIIRDFVNL